MRNKQRPMQPDLDRGETRDSYLPMLPSQPTMESGQQELISMPSTEEIFGRDGLMARLVAGALERLVSDGGGMRAEGGKMKAEGGRNGKRTGRLQLLADDAPRERAGGDVS